MPAFMIRDFRTPVEKFEIVAGIEMITKYPMCSFIFLRHL